jgi:hypothetical protein
VYSKDYFLVLGNDTCHSGKCPDSTTLSSNTTNSKTCIKNMVLTGSIISSLSEISLLKDMELEAKFSYFDPLTEIEWSLDNSNINDIHKFYGKDTDRNQLKITVKKENLEAEKEYNVSITVKTN